MTKNTKTLLFGIPVVIGLYLIYNQLKKSGAKDAANTGGGGGTAPATDFPLQKGSKNATVGVVQTILNSAGEKLVVDSNFGSKTESALLKVFGKKTIDNQADLDSLKNKLATTNQAVSNLDWAWQLVAAALNPDNHYLMVKKAITLEGISKNFLGNWVKSGKNISMPAHNYNLSDYNVLAALNTGQLRISVLSGAAAGMYWTPVGTDLKSTFDIIA